MNIETTFCINNKEREKIDSLLDNGEFKIAFKSNDKKNHIEVIDIQWETPYVIPLQGKDKIIVTFNLEVKSKIRIKKLLKEIILKSMFLHINKKKTKVSFIHFNA